MTKAELIEAMKNWPDDTKVWVSTWPYRLEINAVWADVCNGEAAIIADDHDKKRLRG